MKQIHTIGSKGWRQQNVSSESEEEKIQACTCTAGPEAAPAQMDSINQKHVEATMTMDTIHHEIATWSQASLNFVT